MANKSKDQVLAEAKAKAEVDEKAEAAVKDAANKAESDRKNAEQVNFQAGADAKAAAKAEEVKGAVMVEKAQNKAIAEKVVKEDAAEKARVRRQMHGKGMQSQPNDKDRLYFWMQGKGLIVANAVNDTANFTDLLNILDANFEQAVKDFVAHEGPAVAVIK